MARGSIPAGASATAQFTFTPTHAAAPVVQTHYKIGGTLSYVQNGATITTELVPQDIYVYPDPLLTLDYFLERDVIGDDPNALGTITPQPFYLGLMVNNKGYGKAYNFSVTSAQPKIVENSKGLLINFEITGTAVGTNATSPFADRQLWRDRFHDHDRRHLEDDVLARGQIHRTIPRRSHMSMNWAIRRRP